MKAAVGRTLITALETAMAKGQIRFHDIPGETQHAKHLLVGYYRNGFVDRHGTKGEYHFTINQSGREVLDDVNAGRRKVKGETAGVPIVPVLFDFAPLIAAFRSCLPMYGMDLHPEYMRVCR